MPGADPDLLASWLGGGRSTTTGLDWRRLHRLRYPHECLLLGLSALRGSGGATSFPLRFWPLKSTPLQSTPCSRRSGVVLLPCFATCQAPRPLRWPRSKRWPLVLVATLLALDAGVSTAKVAALQALPGRLAAAASQTATGNVLPLRGLKSRNNKSPVGGCCCPLPRWRQVCVGACNARLLRG